MPMVNAYMNKFKYINCNMYDDKVIPHKVVVTMESVNDLGTRFRPDMVGSFYGIGLWPKEDPEEDCTKPIETVIEGLRDIIKAATNRGDLAIALDACKELAKLYAHISNKIFPNA